MLRSRSAPGWSRSPWRRTPLGRSRRPQTWSGVYDAGALAAVDGVRMAQHRALDLHGLGADILACSPYKFFGPHLGVLAVRRELLETWMPYKLRPAPDEAPERWETGTQNHEGLAGMTAAVDYLAELGRTFGAPAGDDRREEIVAGFDAIGGHERNLSARFLEGITDVPGLRLWGVSDQARLAERTPTFAIRLGDEDPLKTASELARRGIYISAVITTR